MLDKTIICDSPHKKIIIRSVHEYEAHSISELALRSKAHWGYTKDFMKQCNAELSYSAIQISDPTFIFKAAQIADDKQDEIIGFYALRKIDLTSFELEALFINPNYIGQGLGSALLKHAQNSALDEGALSIHIQSDPNAEEFYKTTGAIKIGESESNSIPGRYLPLFTLSLTPE